MFILIAFSLLWLVSSSTQSRDHGNYDSILNSLKNFIISITTAEFFTMLCIRALGLIHPTHLQFCTLWPTSSRFHHLLSQIHPCCHKWQNLPLFKGWIILHTIGSSDKMNFISEVPYLNVIQGACLLRGLLTPTVPAQLLSPQLLPALASVWFEGNCLWLCLPRWVCDPAFSKKECLSHLAITIGSWMNMKLSPSKSNPAWGFCGKE